MVVIHPDAAVSLRRKGSERTKHHSYPAHTQSKYTEVLYHQHDNRTTQDPIHGLLYSLDSYYLYFYECHFILLMEVYSFAGGLNEAKIHVRGFHFIFHRCETAKRMRRLPRRGIFPRATRWTTSCRFRLQPNHRFIHSFIQFHSSMHHYHM